MDGHERVVSRVQSGIARHQVDRLHQAQRRPVHVYEYRLPVCLCSIWAASTKLTLQYVTVFAVKAAVKQSNSESTRHFTWILLLSHTGCMLVE